MIRAVLIDLDDTLVDHQHAMRSALRVLHDKDPRLQALGFDFLLAEWQRVLEAMHDDVAVGRIPIHESRIIRYRHFYDLAGAPVDRAEAEEIAADHMQTYMSNRRIVPGAVALMEIVRQHARTAVVTNNTVIEQDEKLLDVPPGAARAPWSPGGRRPGPSAIFISALERLGVGVDEAVMVGDSWEEASPRQAGCGRSG
ncbi:MAG: hypothetical protein IPO58_24025 [Betaproteobacteria bacterium]|nr:hypothetical protein [Betaproteobacteria bacterium]